ncbi:hypothetical protein Taro_019889 [Colocasia esculenta]|uniref:Uncharacterized protein n=1 Tax=Colocasia esculenta TaxID=4460 RepID=A0A843UUY9_COLES|nr:hypothetical protein [Colocasia esculenta]
MRTSRDVRSRRSSRPQHRRVLYFPHHRLWIMECSCKVWCRPCRRRPTPRLHSKLSWRLRQELGVKALAAKISSLRPAILPTNSLNGQTLPPSSSVQNSRLFCLKIVIIGLVGDTPLEETVESDSERGE